MYSMRFNLDLDFCIIYNPIFENDSYIIYFTRRDESVLDYSLREEENYDELLNFMRTLGYMEVDYLTFDFIGDRNDQEKLEMEDIMARLIEKGVRYNIRFEDVIKETLETLKDDLDSDYHDLLFNPGPARKKETIPSRKYTLPEIGNRLNIYFYLFLECHFLNNSEGFLKVTGDFESKENTNDRNFLRILNTDFVRIKSDDEDYLRFETRKSASEIIKSVSFLQGGYFQISKDEEDEEDLARNSKLITFFYSILEIKNKIKTTDKIIVEVPKAKFDIMMEISQRIRFENKIYEKENITAEDIITSFEVLKKMSNKKMIELAEEEEFRKAAAIKRDIKIVSQKEKFYIENLNCDLTRREYNKFLCFS